MRITLELHRAAGGWWSWLVALDGGLVTKGKALTEQAAFRCVGRALCYAVEAAS